MSALSSWHNRGGVVWRVTPLGVEVEGEGVLRTRGEPITMRLYWAWWSRELQEASAETSVPIALLLMTLGTENGAFRPDPTGHPMVTPIRTEPGYVSDDTTPGRISVGPCHLLISTARAAMHRPVINRAWLLDVSNNVLACAHYIADQEPETQLDPILVAAAYNAGGLHSAPPGTLRGNRWWLRSTPSHLDRAGRWYGDACAVIRDAWELVQRGKVA